MNNTDKIRILKAMRELIAGSFYTGFCGAYLKVIGRTNIAPIDLSEVELNELGLYAPKTKYGHDYWYSRFDKTTRLQKIDEAIAKWERVINLKEELNKLKPMNKEQIKSEMQSIEENIKKETERLNALRLEMDKPEKPTLEEMRKGETFWLHNSGRILSNDSGSREDSYLSRERAEKEKLRIKLSVIADYFNGGVLKVDGEKCYYLEYNRGDNKIAIDWYCNYGAGQIFFKTREHAELAMSYFTNDELIKMLR